MSAAGAGAKAGFPKRKRGKGKGPSKDALRNEELFDAAWDGKESEVTRLLAAGADPNGFTSQSGYTALMRASTFGATAIVRALLNAGARADARGQVRRWARAGMMPERGAKRCCTLVACSLAHLLARLLTCSLACSLAH